VSESLKVGLRRRRWAQRDGKGREEVVEAAGIEPASQNASA